ncbi:MAG: YHS domain-containing protein [Planctomycetia bacterium]|nr:YHS domain-containing protein [Planctomycetia bacterium]
MRHFVLSLTCSLVFLASIQAETPVPKLALKGLDPIELAAGKEVQGKEGLESTHGLFRYRFASEENKAAFDKQPVERGIQFGGACGKMGPFTGMGSPDRFYVHDGRIYVFASEMCRNAFKKDPEQYIEKPNMVPTGTPEQLEQGKVLVSKVLEGFGGANKVDAIQGYETHCRHIYKQNGKELVGHYTTAWSFPDKYRFEEKFTTAYGQGFNGSKGYQFAGKDAWKLDAPVTAVAQRQALREPLAMLRNRQAKGFVAVANGVTEVDGKPLEKLDVAYQGATTTWFIDPDSGRILQLSYLARKGTNGINLVKFGDFKDVEGLVVPFKRAQFFNGKEITSPVVHLDKVVLQPLSQAQFELPK